MKKLFNIFLLFLGFTLSFAQQYPVRIVPNLMQPYSLKLGDYATSTDNKLQLIILMTDLMEPQHQTGLKFSLEAGLNAVPYAQSNDFVVGMQPFMLYPGSNLTLTNIDVRALFELQNLNGINALQYAQPLSDGVYRFCFQAYDFYTKRNLSDKSCATAFLVQYEPPMLNLPQRGEKVIKQGEFQNLVFQWMPRQIAPNTRYIFTLKELWDLERDPVSGFLSSPPLWREETYAPTLFYGLDKTQLIAGKRYAWQVQAKSGNPVFDANPTEDNGVYRNNGLSEIFFFDYVENCALPTLLMAKNAGRGRVELSWNLAGQPSGLYTVQYRKRGSTSQWQTEKSYQPKYIITGLEDQTEYEYRIGSVCGNLQTFNNTNPITDGDSAGNAYAYSGVQYFTTDSKDKTNQNYQCGVMPAVDIANKSPLQSLLGANEVFTAGDFPVTVISAQGSNGIYSGTGYIVVPYLADTKIKVSFNNIKLNTDKKLIEGAIETTYDPNETAVSYASAGLGETFGDAGVKEVTIDFPIGGITYSATPPPGKITITGSDGGGGTGSTVEYSGGKDYQFTDSNKIIWTVDENGTVSGPKKPAKGGASTPANTDGVDSSGSATAITAQGIKVEFENKTNGSQSENSKYAFDKPTQALTNDYKEIDGKFIPFKAVENQKKEPFIAKITTTDTAVKADSLIFKTSKGVAIDSKKVGDDFELTLKGTFSYAKEEVQAVIKQGEKYKIAGVFYLVHISPKTIKLNLVPTTGVNISEEKQKEIKDIYSKVAIDVDISVKPPFDISQYLVDGKLPTADAFGDLSTYSDAQNSIISDYKSKNNVGLEYYIFVTDKPSSTGQDGYMRLNGQFGFVYDQSARTIAHELGHGALKLEHPFKQFSGVTKGSTTGLLDYANGTDFIYTDWKQINDPAFKLYVFQGQSSGQYETDGHYSTVYLVSLMLGMNPVKAKELATATEAPDTTIHNDTKFELNDTWGHMDGSQQNLHSLTGGFHGIEEFFTAIKFLYAPKTDIKLQGEMLHRFGDTYAHSQIGNLKPIDMQENIDLKGADDNTIKQYIKSWSSWDAIGANETTLEGQIKPWIKFFNYYLEKDGFELLNNETKQKEILKGQTLKEALKDIYLKNKTSNFIMYGKNGFTLEHAFKDGGYPDMIYLRPDWYYIYVQNLSWLISTKYELDNSKLDLTVFDKMLAFLKKHSDEKPSMKGIIDYEIAKKLNEKVFYVPVFYASGDRLLALADATVMTDYLKVAKDVVNNTKKYLTEQGISANDIKVEEIRELQSNSPEDIQVNVLVAYKITIK